jgi:hypothetical protein
MLLKAWGPLVRPVGIAAVLDADVIATRPLRELFFQAAAGKVVAFTNDQSGRRFAEWGPLLGLPVPRRQPYVASGHLFVPAARRGFLERYHELQLGLDRSQTLLANDELHVRVTPDDPLYYPDMDVLNALLASEVDAEHLLAVDYRLAPHAPFAGVTLVDERTLACAYADGVAPFVLHHVLRKPWLAPTAPNVYSRLLPRLLLGDDVELRLDPRDLPLRLRRGPLARADARRSHLHAIVRGTVRGRLGIRPRLAAARERRAA